MTQFGPFTLASGLLMIEKYFVAPIMEVQTADASRSISYNELEFIYGPYTYRGRIAWVELILSVCPKCDGLRSLLLLSPPTALLPQAAAISPWPVVISTSGDEALENWPSEVPQEVFQLEKNPSPWFCSLSYSTITAAVGVCLEGPAAEC